jgi:hypothetical protein
MSVGEESVEVSRAFTARPATAAVAPPEGTLTVAKRVPRLSVTVSGQSDVRSHLRVTAVPKGRTCEAPGDAAAPLAPVAPARAIGERAPEAPEVGAESTIVGPGPFSVRFDGAARRLPVSFFGTLRYTACVWLGTPERDLDEAGVFGEHYLQRQTIAAPSLALAANVPALPPAVLGFSVLRVLHPPAAQLGLTFRGCRNDVHTFSGIFVKNPRTRAFNTRLRFSDGRKGRLRGHFQAGWKRMTGRASLPGCSFRFSRRVKKAR